MLFLSLLFSCSSSTPNSKLPLWIAVSCSPSVPGTHSCRHSSCTPQKSLPYFVASSPSPLTVTTITWVPPQRLTIQANMYYKMLIGWTSQKIKEAYGTRNAFDFKHVCSFDRSLVNAPGPCILFATPGMISGGFSLEVFKQWAPSENNLVTLPGYCVAGTVGHKLMSGKPARIDLDKDTSIDVRCQIHQTSFSPHTDAKGIMDLITFLSPKHVVLVHGEKPKMAILKGRIESELKIPCFYPANNETLSIPATQTIKVDITKSFLRNYCITNLDHSKDELPYLPDSTNSHKDISEIFRDERMAEGILMMEKNKIAKIVNKNDLLRTLDAKEHILELAFCFPVKVKNSQKPVDCSNGRIKPPPLLELLLRELKLKINCSFLQKDLEHLQLKSFQSRICLNKLCSYRIEQEERDCKTETFFCCSWSLRDDNLARKIITVMREVELDASNLALQVPDEVNQYMET